MVGLPGRTNRDRRRRRRRGIDRPASARRGAGVTGGVDLAHLERVGTVSETAVGLRARAGRKRRAVEGALEAGTRLSGEGEGGRGLIDQPGRAQRDARRCRSGRVDRPRVARCHSRVPCRVGLPHLERVARCRQATVSPRLVQEANAAPSSAHWNVAPASPVNEKDGAVEFDGLAGVDVRLGAAGAELSTVTLRFAESVTSRRHRLHARAADTGRLQAARTMWSSSLAPSCSSRSSY